MSKTLWKKRSERKNGTDGPAGSDRSHRTGRRSDGPNGSDRCDRNNGSNRSDWSNRNNRSNGSNRSDRSNRCNCPVNICTTRKMP